MNWKYNNTVEEESTELGSGALQVKILSEDRIVEEKTTELLHEWETKKPVQVHTVLWVWFVIIIIIINNRVKYVLIMQLVHWVFTKESF